MSVKELAGILAQDLAAWWRQPQVELPRLLRRLLDGP